MSDVHSVTDVKKSRKLRLPSKKTAMKATAITVFGACVALVGYDKLMNRKSSKTTHTVTETEETTES